MEPSFGMSEAPSISSRGIPRLWTWGLAVGSVQRSCTEDPVGTHLALGQEHCYTSLLSEAMKIIIISETFRFSLPKYFSRATL
jgi:hypothetical protein